MKPSILVKGLAAACIAAGWSFGAERDVRTLNACEVVQPGEVESIVGGKLLAQPLAGSPHCRYTLEMPDGNTVAYQVSFIPASVEEPHFAYLSREGQMEKVAGLWDEALLGAQEFGTGFSLLILRRGDVAAEITGDRKEPLLAIARLIVDRVKPPANP